MALIFFFFFFFSLLLPLLSILHFLNHKKKAPSSSQKRLPPGSMGFPLVGQSLSILRALKSNTADDWLRRRIAKYGHVSKLSLFGTPTVFLSGKSANRFVFTSDALAMQQPTSIKRILGRMSLLELDGDNYRRVRGSLGKFLRPEVFRGYVGKIDDEVRCHIEKYWAGRDRITALPLMKNLTFNITSSLLLGLEHGTVRDDFARNIFNILEGMWSIPINLPFTKFRRSLNASRSVSGLLTTIIHERRKSLKEGKITSHNDLISCLLSLEDGDGEADRLTEEEVLDNAKVVMIGGQDSVATLLTFMIRQMSIDPKTCSRLVQEHEEIAKSKSIGEALTWDDLSKMKYTWKVAMETLRMVPPLYGGFKKVLKDIEYDGYIIPKGWQVFWAACMTHMDDSIFKEPEKFDPSRFDNPTASIPPYCFVSFGAGPRICPGNEFARMVVLITMHYILTRFKWKLCHKNGNFVRFPLPIPVHGLPIELEEKEKYAF